MRTLGFALVAIAAVAQLACSDGGPEAQRTRAVEAARVILADDTISPYDRMVAAGVLYREGDTTGRDYLHGQLVEGSRFAQRAAVSAVFTDRDPAAFEWVMQIAESDELLAQQLVEVLRLQPRPEAREAIETALRSNNPGTRIAALDAAAQTGDPSMREAVHRSLRLPGDSRMFAYGTYALAVLGEPNEGAIEKLVGSEFPSDREIAAVSLGTIDNEWSRVHLEQLVEDATTRVKIAAAASLAQLGDERGVARLLDFIRGPRDDVSEISAAALRRVPPDQILAVARDVLSDENVDPESAARVVEAIGWAPEIDAASILRRAVAHDNETMRLQGLWAVGWRGRAEEVAIAADQLGSRNDAVRAMATWAVVFALDGGHRAPGAAGS